MQAPRGLRLLLARFPLRQDRAQAAAAAAPRSAALDRRALCTPAAAAAPAQEESPAATVAAGQGGHQQARPPFDRGLLEVLVCPLSKKPLRYEESTNELVNEELGIAYPITDGIPNMIPEAARMIGKENPEKDPK